MVTPLKFNHSFSCHYNHQIKTSIKTGDVQNDVVSFMLRLTRFNLSHHQRRRQTTVKPRPNSVLQIVKAVSLTSPMADVPEKVEKHPPVSAEAVAAVEVVKDVKMVQPPTPPEKPEAGDCCGSGCVRCVWDVYYEELETYDQLLQEFNSGKDS